MQKIEKVLDLIFPQVCGICGKVLDKNKENKLKKEEMLCNKCKLLIEKEKYFFKEDYIGKDDIYFDEHIYLFKYDGIIREKIIEYKFNEKSYLYKMFANFFLKDKNTCLILKDYDIIIPVPISKKRLMKRGYNQSKLIARKISKREEIKFENRCLYKNKETIEQSKLNKEERKENIKSAYSIKNEKRLKNKKVILFDDIFTTGSTANECSRILKNAGVQKIGVLTIAKD